MPKKMAVEASRTAKERDKSIDEAPRMNSRERKPLPVLIIPG